MSYRSHKNASLVIKIRFDGGFGHLQQSTAVGIWGPERETESMSLKVIERSVQDSLC